MLGAWRIDIVWPICVHCLKHIIVLYVTLRSFLRGTREEINDMMHPSDIKDDFPKESNSTKLFWIPEGNHP